MIVKIHDTIDFSFVNELEKNNFSLLSEDEVI